MRIGRRVVKALIWGFVLCLSILGGGLWFAYWYMTDGETIAQLIREHAVRYFPGSTLDPGGVQISLFGGKVVFHQLRLIQRIDGAPFEVLRIPWLNIRINTRKLAKGQFGGARGGGQPRRRCDCAAAVTAPGTSTACSPTLGRARGSRRRRSRSRMRRSS